MLALNFGQLRLESISNKERVALRISLRISLSRSSLFITLLLYIDDAMDLDDSPPITPGSTGCHQTMEFFEMCSSLICALAR